MEFFFTLSLDVFEKKLSITSFDMSQMPTLVIHTHTQIQTQPLDCYKCLTYNTTASIWAGQETTLAGRIQGG